MKKINTVIKVSLTYGELMNCLNVDTNRCGYLTEQEAIDNGFSKEDWEKFLKRAKKIKKIIASKGFSKASFFVLAKDEKGNLYLLDGQGRRKALHLMHTEDKCDFSSWDFVCDLYIEPMSKEEMSKLIIDLNTGSTNWQTKDIRRSTVLSSNDPEVKKAYDETKKLMDEYDIGDYVANLLTFGEQASHQRTMGNELSTRDYATTKNLFTEAYIKFIVNASYKTDKNGNSVERRATTRKAIRTVNFAISFNSCLRGIVKAHNLNIDEAKDDVMYFVDRLLSASSGDDNFMEQFVKCNKKDKDAVANKVKSYCRRKSVYNALFAYSDVA